MLPLGIDYELYNILLEYRQEVSEFTDVFCIKKDAKNVTIITDRPGFLIGKGGETIQKYQDKIKQTKYNNKLKLQIEECTMFINVFDKPISEKEYYEDLNDYFMSRGF